MDKKIIFIFIAVILGFAILHFFFFQRSKEKEFLNLPKKGNMKISSSDFKNNEDIPKKYACDGGTYF